MRVDQSRHQELVLQPLHFHAGISVDDRMHFSHRLDASLRRDQDGSIWDHLIVRVHRDEMVGVQDEAHGWLLEVGMGRIKPRIEAIGNWGRSSTP